MNFGGMYNQALSAWDSYLGSQRKQTNIIGQTWLDEAQNKKRLGQITQKAGLYEDTLGFMAELIPDKAMWGGKEAPQWLQHGIRNIPGFRWLDPSPPKTPVK